MSKILWKGNDKGDGELQLERYIKPADPEAVIKKDGDSWVIVGDAILGSQPIIHKKL